MPSKAQQIVRDLRQQIRRMAAGDRLPSVTELKANYATSQHSVDKALAELEREGLITKRPRAGIRVAAGHTGRRGRVAFASWHTQHVDCLPSGFHPYTHPLMQTVLDECDRLGWYATIYGFPGVGLLGSGLPLEEDLLGGRVDGLITHANQLRSDDLAFIEEQQVKLVTLGGAQAFPGVPHVGVNAVQSGLLVAEAVKQANRYPVVIVGASSPGPRVETFRMAFQAAQLPPPLHLPVQTMGAPRALDAGRAAADQLLALAAPPALAWITDDIIALGMIQRLHERDVHIPRDMGIIVNTTTSCTFSHPIARTVFDVAEYGRTAVGLLDALLTAGEITTDAVYVESRLVDSEYLLQEV